MSRLIDTVKKFARYEAGMDDKANIRKLERELLIDSENSQAFQVLENFRENLNFKKRVSAIAGFVILADSVARSNGDYSNSDYLLEVAGVLALAEIAKYFMNKGTYEENIALMRNYD